MPSFSKTPAKMTDPAVGASVWASGSQVWSGNSGTFTANAKANDKNTQRAVVVASDCEVAISTRSKVTAPPVAEECKKTRLTMPTSMIAEPSIV